MTPMATPACRPSNSSPRTRPAEPTAMVIVGNDAMPPVSPEPDSEIRKLIDRMTRPPPSHEGFAGEPIDWSRIDGLGLGDLWAVARETGRRETHGLAADTARAVRDLGSKIAPVF